jgi:hypothetical protein
MKGKVIALWGRLNLGKSETIRKVYELLISKYKDAKTNEYPKPILNRVDIRVVLTINGIKIGIESQGDPGRLPESLSLFVEVSCNIIICATRTRGHSVDAVNALEQNNYDIIWLEKEKDKPAPEWEQINLMMANKLVSEAEKIINA